MLPHRGTPTNICTNLILLETRITGLHVAADSSSLSSLKFFWWSHKFYVLFFSFLQEWRLSHSRSSKVTDVGTNRKRVHDFLLVRHSNLSPILHHFGDFARFLCSWPHPYFSLILEVFSLDQIAHVGVNVSRDLKLFGHESIPTYVITIPKRYR